MSTEIIKNKHIYTKSTSFILPMLGHHVSYYKGIINCYLADFDHAYDDWNFNKIFVLTLENNDQLKYNSYYLSAYIIEGNTGRKYMYVFDIPIIYFENYELFIQGKYSQFTQIYKDHLVSSIKLKPVQDHTVYKVIYKTAGMKKEIEDRIGQLLHDSAEVFSIPDLKQETYGHKVSHPISDKTNDDLNETQNGN